MTEERFLKGRLTSPRNTRADIIHAAIQLLGRGGASGFTASALAAEAGVSKAAIYHHFDGLDAVIVAAFDSFAMQMSVITPPDGMSLCDWLVRFGHDAVAIAEAQRELINAYLVFVTQSLFNPELHSGLSQTLAGIEEATADTMAELLDCPVSREQLKRVAALTLMTLDGLAMQVALFPERKPAALAAWEEFARQTCAQLEAGS